ncbi:hypothetical protein MMC14_005098 [Varicellaria rhodocarpa]|nr:hypothetical protein [Varicellaria rhodocarpa]
MAAASAYLFDVIDLLSDDNAEKDDGSIVKKDDNGNGIIKKEEHYDSMAEKDRGDDEES